MGAKCVIITGATSSNGKISDFILEENMEYVISGKKIPIRNHGSGCNYSASIAVSLAKGKTIQNAVKTAKNYVYQSIRNSKNIGKGVNITHKNISNDVKELHSRITTSTKEMTELMTKQHTEAEAEIRRLREDVTARVGVLERWKYLIIGGSIVVGFVINAYMRHIM